MTNTSKFQAILMSGAACWLGTFATGAAAQTQATPPIKVPVNNSPQGAASDQDIVVTGIRKSLADALSLKRGSDVIGDAIAAEDIGKFPDQNIADSLQRVTGVQIQRANGEGTRVSVRGLSPDFTRTQYNGRTITSNGQRSFDFSSLSSDFISAVEVYKSPTADMIDGGLAATVNVRVARPLDAGKNRLVVQAEGLYESNSKKVGPHVSAFVNKVFGDGKAGVYLGADYRQRKYTTFSVLGFGTQTLHEAAPVDYNRNGDYKDTFAFDHAVGTNIVEGNARRLTLVGGFQAKPTDELDVWADVFYAKLKETQTSHNAIARFTSIAGPNAAVRNSVIDGDLLTYLDADGVWMQSTGGTGDTKTETVSPALGATWKKDRLTVSAEGNYSHTRVENTSIGVEGIGRASISYDLRPDPGGIPLLQFQRGWNPLDPNNYRGVGGGGSYKAPTIDRNWSLRSDLAYELDGGFFKKVMAGANLSDRQLSYRSAQILINAQQFANLLGVPYDPTIENGSFNASIASSAWSFPNAFSSYSGTVRPLTQGISTDTGKILAIVPWSKILAVAPPHANPASDYSVDERSFAAYARVNFAGADNRLTGNLGVRYVQTTQRSIGSVPNFGDITFIQLGAQTLVGTAPAGVVENRYHNWLPSLNVKYLLAPNLALRFAAAKVMTRPTLSLLTTSTNINANVQNISSGNPRLKPFVAKQLDLSLEYYFGKTGLLSAAVFYKDISNFVVNATSTETYPVKIGIGGPPQNITFSHFFPANGAGATLKGLEIGAQVPFTFLPSPLDGFGAIANATFLDVGKVTPVAGGTPTPLPGVSNRSFNVALYYEKYGFSARGAYTYRSGFTNDPLSYFGDGDFARSYGQFDASLGYDINSAISLTLDGANILNKAATTQNNRNVLRTYEDTGRRITAGVRFRM